MSAQDVAAELREVAARLANMTPILEVVAADVRTKIDDSFSNSSTPTGAPWDALSDGTIAINPRRAGGSPLLDTGRLRASITTSVTANSLTFGTNVVYAAAQNFGNPRNTLFGGRPAPIPARQYLPISADGSTLEPADFWREQFQRIERWIVTGEVT